MLLGTLSTSLLGNILARKGINRAGEGVTVMDIKDNIIKRKLSFNAASFFN